MIKKGDGGMGEAKVGYEILSMRHGCGYTPPRPLEVIEWDVWELESVGQPLLVRGLA